MSRENVEAVKQAWDAYVEGRLEAALEAVCRVMDCVVEDYPEMVDGKADYRGCEGLRQRPGRVERLVGDASHNWTLGGCGATLA